MSDTMSRERTISSELQGLRDFPSAARECVGYKRDIKADGSTLWVEVDANDIVLQSIDKRITCHPPVDVCRSPEMQRLAPRRYSDVWGRSTAAKVDETRKLYAGGGCPGRYGFDTVFSDLDTGSDYVDFTFVNNELGGKYPVVNIGEISFGRDPTLIADVAAHVDPNAATIQPHPQPKITVVGEGVTLEQLRYMWMSNRLRTQSTDKRVTLNKTRRIISLPSHWQIVSRVVSAFAP